MSSTLEISHASAKECDLEYMVMQTPGELSKTTKHEHNEILKFNFSVAKVNRENQFENHRKYWKGEHSEDFILRSFMKVTKIA